MATTKRAAAIDRAENKVATVVGIFRLVEVLAELAETDEERDALLLILQGAARLKDLAVTERRSI